VAVQRAVDGDRSVNLNTAERAAAIDQLNARGDSAAKIAETLGLTTRTVVRHRTADEVAS
jgi:DNA-binding NarL/FixJ family response regulator